MRLFFLLLFIFTLLGCGGDIEKHKKVVTNILSDPDSASFREIKQSSKDKDVWCGEINAKNKMGGYAGYTKYVIQTIGFEILSAREVHVSRFLTERDNSSEFQSAWRLFCE